MANDEIYEWKNHSATSIKGVHGEIYPCKPDIFKKTYEVAE